MYVPVYRRHHALVLSQGNSSETQVLGLPCSALASCGSGIHQCAAYRSLVIKLARHRLTVQAGHSFFMHDHMKQVDPLCRPLQDGQLAAGSMHCTAVFAPAYSNVAARSAWEQPHWRAGKRPL